MKYYKIDDEKGIIYIDFERASKKEQDKVAFIAKTNGYKVKEKTINRKPKDKATVGSQKKWFESVLKGEELKAFKENCDRNKTHKNKKGETVKNSYLYAVSEVYKAHPEYKDADKTTK